MPESDPHGKDAHSPGAKLDQGKVQVGLLQDFALALTEVARVSTYGKTKYSRGGWQHVTDGVNRYTDAMLRHWLKERWEWFDQDTGIYHAAHLAWNALARLDLMMREPLVSVAPDIRDYFDKTPISPPIDDPGPQGCAGPTGEGEAMRDYHGQPHVTREEWLDAVKALDQAEKEIQELKRRLEEMKSDDHA